MTTRLSDASNSCLMYSPLQPFFGCHATLPQKNGRSFGGASRDIQKTAAWETMFDEATPNLARKSVKERKCLGTKNKLKQKLRTTLKREGN